MPKTYYDSELTAAEIESVLEAIHGVVSPSNNGKILGIESGRFVAKSASEYSGDAVLEPLNVSANGDYYPRSGTDGFDEVHVSVPGSTLTTKNITQNGTYNASSDNADGYSSVVVNVSGGGSSAVVQPLSVAQNGTYNPPSGVDGYAPVTVNVSGGGGAGLVVAVATASSTHSIAYSVEKAFEGGFWGSNGDNPAYLRMDFQSPVKITGITFGNTMLGSGNLHWSSSRVVFQASNDDTAWTDLYDAQNLSDDPNNLFTYAVQNNNAYLYYRFVCYKGNFYAGIGNVQISYNSGSSAVQPLSVTQNGTYNPPTGVDGYAPVTVNVSGGGGGGTKEFLYEFNESQGNVWINTNVSVSNIETLCFDDVRSGDVIKYVVIDVSDIAVYTGGADVYTLIFTQTRPMNVRIYNGNLYVSYNGAGPATNVTKVYKYSESAGGSSSENASVFKWLFNSATTCWGIMKKLTGDVIGQNGDNANASISLVGDLMTVTFHGTSQAVEVVANSAIKLKAYTTGRTLGPATMTEYAMAANAQQNFTTDDLYGGLYLEAESAQGN